MTTMTLTPQEITEVSRGRVRGTDPNAPRNWRRSVYSAERGVREFLICRFFAATQAELDEIERVYGVTEGAGGVFTWQSPVDSGSETYRFTEGSLDVTQASAVARYEIAFEVERIRE